MDTKHISFERGTERWLMTVKPCGEVCVTCAGETRYYNVDTPIKKIVHEEEYVYVYTEINIYQFKFEVDNFLVGDILDFDFEWVDDFAMHVFGEDL